jgi:hypothetical protein
MTTLSKAQLQHLAEAEVRQRVADLERELAMYQKSWPDIFIAPTAPQLLKALPKPTAASMNGNGNWPAVTFVKSSTTKKKHDKRSTAWTPARRKAQSRRMKKQRAKSSKGRAGRLGKVQAYLHKHGESSLQDLMTASGYTSAASIISAMNTGLKSGDFKRVSKGRYTLGPAHVRKA